MRFIIGAAVAVCAVLVDAGAANAQAFASIATPVASGADTSWVLTATALVLFMTLPGLALFYAGLVQHKNVLSVMMHCVIIACLVSVLWFAFGYSLAFSGSGGVIGNLDRIVLAGAGRTVLRGTLPEPAFVMFQMTFAIITPALIVGAYTERVRFDAVILFSALWLMFVYVPVTHWVWGRRLARSAWRHGLRWRHCGARHRRLFGAFDCSRGRRPRRLPGRFEATPQPRDDHDRRGDAVGRMVWFSTLEARSPPTVMPRQLSSPRICQPRWAASSGPSSSASGLAAPV